MLRFISTVMRHAHCLQLVNKNDLHQPYGKKNGHIIKCVKQTSWNIPVHYWSGALKIKSRDVTPH